MKKLYFLAALFFSAPFLFAQIIPVKNGFQADLASVIRDYPNHFANIIGELLVKNPQSEDYSSQIIIGGAEESMITKYSSGKKAVYSWQALMLKTDEHEVAAKKFKALFNSINNLTVVVGEARLVFKGIFVNPSEEKKFSSIVFSPGIKSGNNKIIIELMLQSEMMEWAVRLLVYEKEKEDDERGSVIEN